MSVNLETNLGINLAETKSAREACVHHLIDLHWDRAMTLAEADEKTSLLAENLMTARAQLSRAGWEARRDFLHKHIVELAWKKKTK